jgi:hypothetical protein
VVRVRLDRKATSIVLLVVGSWTLERL